MGDDDADDEVILVMKEANLCLVDCLLEFLVGVLATSASVSESTLRKSSKVGVAGGVAGVGRGVAVGVIVVECPESCDEEWKELRVKGKVNSGVNESPRGRFLVTGLLLPDRLDFLLIFGEADNKSKPGETEEVEPSSGMELACSNRTSSPSLLSTSSPSMYIALRTETRFAFFRLSTELSLGNVRSLTETCRKDRDDAERRAWDDLRDGGGTKRITDPRELDPEEGCLDRGSWPAHTLRDSPRE